MCICINDIYVLYMYMICMQCEYMRKEMGGSCAHPEPLEPFRTKVQGRNSPRNMGAGFDAGSWSVSAAAFSKRRRLSTSWSWGSWDSRNCWNSWNCGHCYCWNVECLMHSAQLCKSQDSTLKPLPPGAGSVNHQASYNLDKSPKFKIPFISLYIISLCLLVSCCFILFRVAWETAVLSQNQGVKVSSPNSVSRHPTSGHDAKHNAPLAIRLQYACNIPIYSNIFQRFRRGRTNFINFEQCNFPVVSAFGQLMSVGKRQCLCRALVATFCPCHCRQHFQPPISSRLPCKICTTGQNRCFSIRGKCQLYNASSLICFQNKSE